MFIWNELLIALSAPLFESATWHLELTITFFSNVMVMPPLTRKDAHPLRCEFQLRFDGLSRTTA